MRAAINLTEGTKGSMEGESWQSHTRRQPNGGDDDDDDDGGGDDDEDDYDDAGVALGREYDVSCVPSSVFGLEEHAPGRHKKTKTTPRTSKGSRVASCGRSPVLNSTQQWRLQVSFGVSSCRTLAPVQKHFENTPNVHQNWRTNSINRTWNSNISLFIPMSFRCLWDFHRFSRFLCITSYRNARFQPTSLSPSRFEARCQRQRSRLSRFRHWRSVDNLRVLKMGDFHWKDIILRVFWD